MNDADLVTGYLAHAETVSRHGMDAENITASDELHSRIWDEPERAWPVICEIIKRIVDDDMLAFVGAGPLEDLLVHHPHAFIDRVEALAREDAHFRRAVSGVWGSRSLEPEIRKRLHEFLGDESRL